MVRPRLGSLLAACLVSGATAEASTSYDCDWGFEDWEVLWTPEYKTWCCQHEGKGCTMSTTRTATRTSTLTLTRTTTMLAETACKVECAKGNTSATCGERILWVRAHNTTREASPCGAATRQVLQEFPEECAFCTAEATGCSDDDDDDDATAAVQRRFGLLPRHGGAKGLGEDPAFGQTAGARRRMAQAFFLGAGTLLGVALVVLRGLRSKKAEAEGALYSDILLQEPVSPSA